MSEYTGFNFAQIQDLDVFEYFALLRDAVVYRCMQTEEGQKYLDKCWTLEQTAPDRKRLCEKFGKTTQ